MIRILTFLAAFAASMPSNATAQVMGARELNIGMPMRGAPSTKPVADIYYLVGETGSKETYTLNVKGPASIALFGPDGSEILTATGTGSVKLEVVLPFTDVFTLAVARSSPAAPYSLSRKATVPTLTEALMAGSVGYEAKDAQSSQCWLIPGVKMRVAYAKGMEQFTLAADRNTATFVSVSPSGTLTGEASFQFGDKTVTRTARYLDGKVQEESFEPKLSYDPERDGRFTGYLCNS